MKIIPKNKKVLPNKYDLERFFDDFLVPSGWSDNFDRLPEGNLSFDMDVSESESGYHIEAELPGMEEKDIEVSIEGSHLIIKGEKTEESKEEDKNYYSSERRYGSFTRSISLPENADVDKARADYRNGVLEINIPKAADSPKRQKITVQKK